MNPVTALPRRYSDHWKHLRMPLTLVPVTAQLARTDWVRGSALLASLCDGILATYPGGVPELPWAGYIAEDDEGVVGVCAFRSRPVAGEVEITYFTLPGHAGKGVATGMAEQLVSLAARQGRVTAIRAHTQPQTSAATRVLEKLWFSRTDAAPHPGGGEMWAWRRVLRGRD